MWKIKGQLDATDWILLQNLLSAQHVSGTIVLIIRSSRIIQMVVACGTWLFGLLVVGLVGTVGFVCPGCAGYCASKIQSVASSWPFIFRI
jgi:hypothetical protein